MSKGFFFVLIYFIFLISDLNKDVFDMFLKGVND